MASCQPINRPPLAPNKPFPADGATDQPLNLKLSWTCKEPDGDYPLKYDVYLGKTKNNLNKISSKQIENNIELKNLEYATKYYWKVIPYDSKAKARDLAINTWSFKTTALIIDDDFEDYVFEETPNSFEWVDSYYQKTSYAIITNFGKTGKGLTFFDSSYEGYAIIKKTWGSLKKGTLEFDFKIVDNDGLFRIRFYPLFSTPAIYIGKIDNSFGFFALNHSGKKQKISSLLNNVWYSVQLKLDLEKREYRIFINDEFKDTIYTVDNNSGGLEFVSFSNSVCHIFNIDNLKLYVENTYEPAN